MGGYIPRIVDGEIRKRLGLSGGVSLCGPAGCGKTRTAMESCRSVLDVTPDRVPGIEMMVDCCSKFCLEGEAPRLLDEWQRVPDLWDLARFEIDHRHKPGQFVLASSWELPMGSTSHSGIGRISSLRMRTMGLAESGESDGSVSLRGMFEGVVPDSRSDSGWDELSLAIIRGGWPDSMGERTAEDAGMTARGCLREVAGTLVPEILDMADGGESIAKVLEAVSRRMSEPACIATVASDPSVGMSAEAVRRRIAALRRLYIVENLESWCFRARTGTRLDVTPRWHLADPSLEAAAMGIGCEDIFGGGEVADRLFASLCLRDLRVYADAIGADVGYIRNNNGYGVDFAVQLRDGRWGAFQAVRESEGYGRAAARLLKLKSFVDTDQMGEPAFLSILTSERTGSVRGDGVAVVPIGCLGP